MKKITSIVGLKIIIIAILIFLLGIFSLAGNFSTAGFLSRLLPVRMASPTSSLALPQSHLPELTLSFDQQGYNQCAGYAAAFIRRYYGQEVYGSEVYRQISYNLPIDIGVPPHRLLRHFREHNLKATARKGDFVHIKNYAARDIPSIVLVGEGISWQHYMVFLGYDRDKNELYFYDSEVGSIDRNRQAPGNRTMTEEQFLEVWNNSLPGFSQMFITVEPIINPEIS